MTPSSPETVRPWAPVELHAAGPGGAAAPVPAPRPGALFELAAASDIPPALLEPARLQAESIGYVAGWRQGMAAAAKAAADAAERAEQERAHVREREQLEIASALHALHRAAAELREREASAGAELEQLVVDTAFGIAEALVGIHLADDAQRGALAVGRALALCPPGAEITLRISAADHAALTDAPLPDGITLAVDETLQPGDACASFGASSVDARLSSALDRVRSALHDGRPS